MSRRYGIPIRVWRASQTKDAQRRPAVLSWRGTRYRVRSVLGEWKLTTRWWVAPQEAWQTGRGYSDRHYYRLVCQESGADWDMLCEVYYDRAINTWVMDRIID